jgi:hypothetical protein
MSVALIQVSPLRGVGSEATEIISGKKIDTRIKPLPSTNGLLS